MINIFQFMIISKTYVDTKYKVADVDGFSYFLFPLLSYNSLIGFVSITSTLVAVKETFEEFINFECFTWMNGGLHLVPLW